jgi:drug/metabolite transporter (DMT)-like permease
LPLTSIGLILLSSVFHALWNVLTQTSKNSQHFSGLKGLFIILMALGSLALFDFEYRHPLVIFWAVVSGLLHGMYILALSRAYNTQDISYVYPIARSAPVFVPWFAFLFLGEKIPPATGLAIILIVLAIYILHFDGRLIRGFRNLWDAMLYRDLRWAFVTLGLVVAYSLVDKVGMKTFYRISPDSPFANGIVFFFLESLVGFSLCLVYLFVTQPVRKIFISWRNEWKVALIAGLATMGSYGLICVVLQFEAVSAVVTLRQTSVLMVVAYGCWKLKEPFGGKRLLAAVLIVVGVALMGFNND